MPYERLRTARKKVVGTKQTTKSIQKGEAKVVFVAKDAEERLTRTVAELCSRMNVPLTMVDSMADLGRACGIQVGAAAAAIIEE